MRFAAGVVLFGVSVVLAAGCQQSSSATRPAPPIAEVDHAAEGNQAFDRQEWQTAASHYRLALQKTPDNLTIHYRLAISVSWLDLRQDAMTEFEWVVANAAASSEEARVAREWLAAARERSVASSPSTTSTRDERVGDSGLHGRAVGDNGEPLKRIQLNLYAIGDDGRTKGMSFRIRSDREGNYAFSNIPAGTYKLTDNNVGVPRWRLKVDLRPGQDSALDLGPDNTLNARDDFPRRS